MCRVCENEIYWQRFKFYTDNECYIIDRRNYEIFCKNNFFVTISFDGPQVIQDKNRVMADGKSGSFETVMKNVEMFLNKYPDFLGMSVSMQYWTQRMILVVQMISL